MPTDPPSPSFPSDPLAARRIAAARRAVGGSWGHVQPERWAALLALGTGSVLDLGCAGGAYVHRLRAEGREAWGVDLLRGEGWTGACFGQAEGTRLPFADRSFDYASAFEVIEHVPGPERVVRELARVARRSIILSVPNCATPVELRRAGLTFHHWVDRSHVNFFDARSLAELLTATGLRVREVRGINPVSPERLMLAAWQVPDRAAAALARRLTRLPGRRAFPMTLLAVADVPEPVSSQGPAR